MFTVMKTAIEHGSLVSASIKQLKRHRKFVLQGQDGLVSAHAYMVTSVKLIENKKKEVVKLVRIRNPWGDEIEWKVSFCDGSSAWDSIAENVKHELEVCQTNNGEFYMDFFAFMFHFTQVDICHVSAEFDGENKEQFS